MKWFKHNRALTFVIGIAMVTVLLISFISGTLAALANYTATPATLEYNRELEVGQTLNSPTNSQGFV